jgi:hypothetical protein
MKEKQLTLIICTEVDYSATHDATFAEKRAAKRERADAVAALHAMWAARPLKPPPLPYTGERMRTSKLALSRDIASGAYKP